MTTRTRGRRAARPVQEEVVEEEIVVEELDDDDMEEGVSGVELLDLLDDSEGPSTEEMDTPRFTELPDGAYVARLVEHRLGTYNKKDGSGQGLRVSFFAEARGVIPDDAEGVEPKYVGRRLPIQSVLLTNDKTPNGSRYDWGFWNVANAIIGRDAVKEIQEESPLYKDQVTTILDELSAAITGDYAYYGVRKVTKPNERDKNNPYHNIDRVFALPEGIEPIDSIDDA